MNLKLNPPARNHSQGKNFGLVCDHFARLDCLCEFCRGLSTLLPVFLLLRGKEFQILMTVHERVCMFVLAPFARFLISSPGHGGLSVTHCSAVATVDAKTNLLQMKIDAPPKLSVKALVN